MDLFDTDVPPHPQPEADGPQQDELAVATLA
jgi:hypothetical protein